MSQSWCAGMEDISSGLEHMPTGCDCETDPAGRIPVPVFRYITRSIPGPGCDHELFSEQLAGCDCQGSCDSHQCPCISRFGQNYDEATCQLLPTSVSSAQLRPVYECNSQCKCSRISRAMCSEQDSRSAGHSEQHDCDTKCHNRVVQNGPCIGLKVVHTSNRGFGLFARKKIKQLQFVCEYAGEVVGVAEAAKRLKEMEDGVNYLIVLKEHCSSGVFLTCVDPRSAGNVGRFANHSCDPNLLMVPVRVDHNVPRLALFARRDISVGEELTFDYSGQSLFEDSQPEAHSGQNFRESEEQSNSAKFDHTSAGDGNLCADETMESISFKRTKCLCGSHNCKGFLPYDELIFS